MLRLEHPAPVLDSFNHTDAKGRGGRDEKGHLGILVGLSDYLCFYCLVRKQGGKCVGRQVEAMCTGVQHDHLKAWTRIRIVPSQGLRRRAKCALSIERGR